MSLLKLYVPRDLSFISTQFLFLNVDGWFFVWWSKFILFWYSVIILHYYINLRSSIILYRCSGEISFFKYFFFFICFWIILWWSFWDSKFYQQLYFQLNHQFLCCFFNRSFWSSVKCICSRSRSFWLYLLLRFLLIFYLYF